MPYMSIGSLSRARAEVLIRGEFSEPAWLFPPVFPDLDRPQSFLSSFFNLRKAVEQGLCTSLSEPKVMELVKLILSHT